MSEAVTSSNELLNALDPNKRVGRRDTNNLALADQIQFSSILRTLVDTPEQMMEVATGPAKPRDLDHRGEEPKERDVSRAKQTERKHDQRREVAKNERDDEPKPERPEPFAAQRTITNEATNTETVPEQTAPVPETAAPQTATIPAEKPFRDQVLEAPKTTTAATAPQTDKPVATAAATVSKSPDADMEHAAQSIIAGALTNKQFSRVGEDIHDAANLQPTKTATHAGGQTAANSLKDEQASDLSNRLGNIGAVSVKVDAANDAAKSKSAQLPGSGANVDFGRFEGFDINDPAANGQFKGNGEGTERKAGSNHANLPSERLGAATPQDLANAFGQAMRAQGAMIGAQQAAAQGAVDGKVQITTADAIQATNAAAPSGPSQLSQTAKANPTTATRQPEKPQTPAEQIAVKIRQAVGEGNDKINIKLNPHELGRVEVRIELAKDGTMTATVLAERKETLDILQRDARGLERALNDAGLRTDAASLSFGLRGDGQKTVDNGRDRRSGTNSRSDDRADKRIEFGDSAASAKAGFYGRTANVNGGVDIRV